MTRPNIEKEVEDYKPHGDHKPEEPLQEGGFCTYEGLGKWTCGHED